MVILKGEGLAIEDVVRVSRQGEQLQVSPGAMEMVKKNRDLVEELIKQKKPLYGVSTGIGELGDVILSPDQLKDFQKYLIYSHAAGWGEPVDEDEARAAIVTRLNTLVKGYSGLRPIIIETLKEMVNKGVTPVMCRKGSVGASGDLSPLAQMALVMMGDGEAFYQGQRMPGKGAMERAGIRTIELEARDGLATINGSNLIAGMGSLQVYDTERLLKTAEIAAGMTLEGLRANMKAYDERIHVARGYPGAVRCARNIRRIVEGSEILAEPAKKVQDAYSLRSTPQVIGSAKDTLDFSRRMFEIEINGVADNPIFSTKDRECLTGANFQGTPLAFALEFLGIALTTVGVLSERRLNRLLNPVLSNGLPGFLTKGGGMFSGMMVTQYTAAALVAENRILCTPAAVGSIPTSADQEDFVSMGMTSAIKTKDILKNIAGILAIELIAGAQALEFRKPKKPGRGVQAAVEIVRKYVSPLEEDRPLYLDIEKISLAVQKGEILEAVERDIGGLE